MNFFKRTKDTPEVKVTESPRTYYIQEFNPEQKRTERKPVTSLQYDEYIGNTVHINTELRRIREDSSALYREREKVILLTVQQETDVPVVNNIKSIHDYYEGLQKDLATKILLLQKEKFTIFTSTPDFVEGYHDKN